MGRSRDRDYLAEIDDPRKPSNGIVDTAEWPRCAMIGRIESLRIVSGNGADRDDDLCMGLHDIMPL